MLAQQALRTPWKPRPAARSARPGTNLWPGSGIRGSELMTQTHILSVTYDSSLLKTREMVLHAKGYRVTSALGLDAALAQFRNKGERFDAVVIGHSIPHSDKEALVEVFRANSAGPVIALKKPGEKRVRGADVEILPDPEELIATLAVRLPTPEQARGG
jgi:CheY-like chemotaxis protein